jgi:hypothetical protein
MFTQNKTLLASVLLALSFTTGVHAQGANLGISLILDGRYASYSNDTDYALPGFMLGGEAGRGEEGFHLGHNELIVSGNIDDMFYGKMTTVITDHESETEVELEEMFIETQGLGNGFTIKAGRFFSDIGYLNSHHGHTWDFVDAPLVYSALFGNQLKDDGLQVSWLAPTDLYFKVGVEALRGGLYPAGGAENDGNGANSVYLKLGGDVGNSNSWQVGLSHWKAEVSDKEAGGHDHGGADEIPTFNGDSEITGIDFVWKWAPNGNSRETNFKFQAEYFEREEDGDVELVGALTPEVTTYQGKQKGWYMQAVYQFMPRWRVGLRYDSLTADNTGSDVDVLDEAGLITNDHDPSRSTLMVDYSRSEFSRVRLQYASDDSYEDSDNIITLQYIMSLGKHGAHKF